MYRYIQIKVLHIKFLALTRFICCTFDRLYNHYNLKICQARLYAKYLVILESNSNFKACEKLSWIIIITLCVKSTSVAASLLKKRQQILMDYLHALEST